MVDERSRWQRRYARERAARFEAEQIAERAIADLQQANAALDQRVVDRTEALEAALFRLTEADTAKSTFVHGLAHEMSTPLHAIAGLVEFIEAESNITSVKTSARQAGDAAQRLNRALRTLLEFAAISHNEMPTTEQALPMDTYADTLSARWQRPAARAGMLLIVEVGPDPKAIMNVDPARLDQIVNALLDNGVKFGSGELLLSLNQVAEPAPHLRIEVSDQGQGVPQDLRDKVFESFVRDRHATEGFGVGLTLARAVAEGLGGSLELSESTVGAHFVALVPLART